MVKLIINMVVTAIPFYQCNCKVESYKVPIQPQFHSWLHLKPGARNSSEKETLQD